MKKFNELKTGDLFIFDGIEFAVKDSYRHGVTFVSTTLQDNATDIDLSEELYNQHVQAGRLLQPTDIRIHKILTEKDEAKLAENLLNFKDDETVKKMTLQMKEMGVNLNFIETNSTLCNTCRVLHPSNTIHVCQDNVNHPKHYNSHPSGIECITVTEHMSFNIGNAVKYLWRQGLKADSVEDMQKAIWYINREIERVKNAKSN